MAASQPASSLVFTGFCDVLHMRSSTMETQSPPYIAHTSSQCPCKSLLSNHNVGKQRMPSSKPKVRRNVHVAVSRPTSSLTSSIKPTPALCQPACESWVNGEHGQQNGNRKTEQRISCQFPPLKVPFCANLHGVGTWGCAWAMTKTRRGKAIDGVILTP